MSFKFFITNVRMPRRKQTPIGSAYIGRQVKQPAHEFGKPWALEEYGDDWDTAWVCGTVSDVHVKGTTSRKTFMVRWANGDDEPMSQAQMESILVPDSAAEAAEAAGNFTHFSFAAN